MHNTNYIKSVIFVDYLQIFPSSLSHPGNVPCSVIYGAVVDSACLVWEKVCEKTGACTLYDSNSFRLYFHGNYRFSHCWRHNNLLLYGKIGVRRQSLSLLRSFSQILHNFFWNYTKSHKCLIISLQNYPDESFFKFYLEISDIFHLWVTSFLCVLVILRKSRNFGYLVYFSEPRHVTIFLFSSIAEECLLNQTATKYTKRQYRKLRVPEKD